jgi:hypothetical protein
MKPILNCLIILSLTGYVSAVTAIDFYNENFDNSGAMPAITANPIFSLTGIFTKSYGPGDAFEVTNTTSHSGDYSLRFNYEHKNGLCNACGLNFVNHKQGLNEVDFFVADTGEDLTLTEDDATRIENDGPAAKAGRIIYNSGNGFSKWQVSLVGNHSGTNDKLTVGLLKSGIDGTKPQFNGGDSVFIARECGVDGYIAQDINKRSDCNPVIIWFHNVSAQSEGASIFRRQYLKAEITNPFIHQKLHYFRPGRNTPFSQEIVLGVDTNPPIRELKLQLTNFKPLGGSSIYVTGLHNGFDGFILERSTWFYIEEEYLAATFNGTTYNNDGAYRLWFSKSGLEPNQASPSFELLNIPLPPLNGTGTEISLWGNFQHNTDSRGSWYIDDVAISDTFNGAVPQSETANNSTPPKAPKALKIE